MTRKTFLDCVNSTLKRLRRSTVSSSGETTASSLTAEFVRDAISHVEGSHNWSSLFSELNFSTSNGDALYSLVNWQDDGRIEAVRNVTPGAINELKRKSASGWRYLNESVANGRPSYFRLVELDSNGDPQIELHPTPDAAYNIRVYGYVGQGSGIADAAIVCVPSKPVILFAWAYAIRERGEDGGTSFQEAQEIADEALNDAIDVDVQSQADGIAYGWDMEYGRVV